MTLQKIIKPLLFLIWLALIGATIYYYLVLDLSLHDYNMLIMDYIAAIGIWGPILFILIYTIRPLIFFPATLLTALSGILFGPWFGILYTIIGANLSANIAFLVSRFFARHLIKSHEQGWLRKFDDRLRDRGFITILLMRLLYFPYDVVNYGAGLSAIHQRDFAIATILGTLPGTATFVFLGGSFADPRSLALAALTFVIGFTISKLLSKKHQNLAATKDKI